jgi:hypothetical protein
MRTRGMHDLILGEKFLATHGRGLSVVTGECPGHHAHPKEEGTGFPCGFLKSALVRFFYFPAKQHISATPRGSVSPRGALLTGLNDCRSC